MRFYGFWVKTLRRKYPGAQFAIWVGWPLGLIPEKTSSQTYFLLCMDILVSLVKNLDFSWLVEDSICALRNCHFLDFRQIHSDTFGWTPVGFDSLKGCLESFILVLGGAWSSFWVTFEKFSLNTSVGKVYIWDFLDFGGKLLGESIEGRNWPFQLGDP